eukprot:6198717-Prymnesium_polylepis.1
MSSVLAALAPICHRQPTAKQVCRALLSAADETGQAGAYPLAAGVRVCVLTGYRDETRPREHGTRAGRANAVIAQLSHCTGARE